MPEPTAVFGLKEAFEVFVKHREAVMSMWSFFSAGTLAVLGFTIGSDKATLTVDAKRIVQLGFFVFAVGNLAAIYVSQIELRAIAAVVRRLAVEQKLAEFAVIEPLHPLLLVAFHLAVSSAVLVAIHLAHTRRMARMAPNPSVKGTSCGKPQAAPYVER